MGGLPGMPWSLPWPFDRTYMQLALLAGVVVGATAPLIGVFIVQRGMSLVGEGQTAADVRRLASAEAPDIVILDIAIAGGLEAVAKVAKRKIKCVVLTMLDDALTVSNAIAAGANGYVLKGVSGVELVDALIGQQILHQAHGTWGVSGTLEAVAELIPASLQTLIEQHVAQLSLHDQRLLEAASVAGVEFAAAAVAAGLGQGEERVEARCTALAQQGRLLQASGHAEWPDGTVTACYGFRHALYQEVFYQRVPTGRQSRWHARIGTRLERGFGEYADEMAAALAMHLVRGRLLPQAVPLEGQKLPSQQW